MEINIFFSSAECVKPSMHITKFEKKEQIEYWGYRKSWEIYFLWFQIEIIAFNEHKAFNF